MSDKFCCVTYMELYPELAQIKSDEIDGLVKEKGIPRSVFAGVIKLVNGLGNYCPYCGTCLNPELTYVATKPANIVQQVMPVADNKPIVPVKVRCNACAGRGILGRDKNQVDIRCMKCHGEGTFQSKHIAEDPRAKFAQNKVDQVREDKGMGENPVFAPEE